MQRAWLLPVSVVAATSALIVSARPPAPEPSSDADEAYGAIVGTPAPAPRPGAERLDALTAYVDPDFGFSLAVPMGWTAMVLPESDAELEMLEPGYAVAFESPLEHEDDRFVDYLMVEILPGAESGLFETDGSRRRETVVDGRHAWRDALSLPAAADDARAVDLIVRQATSSGLGYTVAFFAVGEPARRPLIDDAFEAMLRTFRLPRRPFDVS